MCVCMCGETLCFPGVEYPEKVIRNSQGPKTWFFWHPQPGREEPPKHCCREEDLNLILTWTRWKQNLHVRWGRNIGVVGRIMLPCKDVHILTPGTCGYVPPMAKETLQVWLRIWRYRDYPGIANIITWVLIRERWKGNSKIGKCYTAGFEDGGRSHKPRNVGSF